MKRALSGYLLLAIVIVFIAVWAIVSWYFWSDVGARRIKQYPVIQITALPILILSWPAHEVCLGISGVGFGANVRSAATVWTFVVFLIQANLTWSLLLVAVIIRKRFIYLLIAQLALLLLIFAAFWIWGNG